MTVPPSPLHPRKDGGWNFVETTSLRVTAGTALAQTVSSFASASVQGNYAARFNGTDFISNKGQEDITGRLVPNGGSAIAGTLDINDAGVTSTAAGLQVSSYSVGSNGRGSATMQTNASIFSSASFNLYVVDSSTVLFLESDGNRVLTGVMQKEY